MPAGNSSSRPGSGRSSGRSNSSSSRGGFARPSAGRGGSSSRGSSSSSRGGSSRPGASRDGASRGGSSRGGSTGGRAGGSGRPSSGRPSSSRSGEGRPSSGRSGGAGRPSSGRPSSGRASASGERRSPRVVRDGEERSSRSYGDRPSSGRPARSSADRPSRPGAGRPSSGRPSSGRPTGDGAPRSDRSYGDRPREDREARPRREWSRDERPKASDDRRSGGRPDSRGGDRARGGRDDRPRRDDRGADRGGYGDRPRGGRPDRAGGRFQDRDERPRAPRGEKRVNVQDPIIPDHITGNELPRNVRNELRTLPDGLALRVARHLAASGAFMDSDPELAWQHAKAALNKASRVGIIREAAAEAAYNAGHFAEALTEFRAARRMRGIKEYWPLMADCERALGRPEKAIAMAGDPLVASLDRASRVEMRIVAAGARVDQKKLDAALATLQCPELTTTSTEPWAARIRYAYADVLAKMGRKDEAIEWFHRAAAVDMEQQTDADERVAELEGRPSSEYDYEDFEDEVFEDWEDED